MSCVDVERDLDPYIDRELSRDGEAVVRQHLQTCAICRRRVSDREASSSMMRTTAYYTAPDRLRAGVIARVERSRTRQRVLAWAAAAMFALSLGGGAAWLIGSRGNATAGPELVAEVVVDGHVRSLLADHLLDVASTDQHTVKPWFLGKLDFAPPVIDLASEGYPLIGGRLDYLSGEPAAAVVYQRRNHTINVFIRPSGVSDAAAATRSIRGFHVREWTREGMSFWAVSDLNEGELSAFVRALQQTGSSSSQMPQ